MKICMLSSVHDVEDTRIFYKEAQSLKELGHDVYYIVQNDKEEMRNGIHIIPLKKPKSRFTRMTKTLAELYERAKFVDADVYHFHDPELLPIGILLKRRGKCVIYDVHEDVPRQILSKYWIPGPMRRMISVLIEKLENRCVLNFDGIITATPHIAERFHHLNRNTVFVCNYPLLNEFPEQNIDWRKKEKNICYVGGISKVRGIFEMVSAIGKTNGQLLLAGSFNNGDLRDEVIKLQGWSQVKELGFINRTEVKKTLHHSAVGLYIGHPITNYVHSLPIKVFEYMAAGIPVIASNFPLLQKVVQENQCGFCVKPLDSEALANRIQWLINHPKEAEEMGRRGRQLVLEKYNWDKESVKLKELYDEIAWNNKGVESNASG